MNGYRKCIGLIVLIAVTCNVAACGINEFVEAQLSLDNPQTPQQQRIDSDIKFAPYVDINDIGIADNKSIYSEDDPGSIVYFYVTVKRGTQGTKTDHSFEEVNNNIKFSKSDEVRVGEDVFAEALVQVGDEQGPLANQIGYGLSQPNATIRKRGSSSSNAPQKSYALKLNKGIGLWRGQTNIALNKHFYDPLRFKNKLYFDLLKEVPDVPSLRTQFVRLFIKDETSGSQEFVDYGVYTQAEVPNKTYLRNHGLDASGYLYKAINFNFEKAPALTNFDDETFNKEAFEQIMSCKGREDNQKLLEMLDAVNDMSKDIDGVIDQYFDRDNYITWLAYNILMGNIDVTMQNFYLYSPLNGEKWYFIPWDGDAALNQTVERIKGDDKKYDQWVRGASNYWGVVLHQRFLKGDNNRQQLADKMETLRKLITTQKLQQYVNTYTQAIDPYVKNMPDLINLGYTLEEREAIIRSLTKEMDSNYDAFVKSLDNIMPFYLYDPVVQDTAVVFEWGDAYDFKNQDISYRFVISKNVDLSEPIFSTQGNMLSVSIPKPGSGTYYWGVQASTADGRTVRAFNKTQVEDLYGLGVEKLVIQ